MPEESGYTSWNDVYKSLRDDILSLKIQPGEIISENAMARRFGVSRTPVRSALGKLKTEKLVDIVPQKGTFAAMLDLEYIRQIVYMRVATESQVVRDAMRDDVTELVAQLSDNLERQRVLIARPQIDTVAYYKLDSYMHRCFYTHTGKLRLWNILQGFHVHYTRFRMLDVVDTKTFQLLYDEHASLCGLVENRDFEAVYPFMKKHLYGAISRLQDTITTEYSSFFTSTASYGANVSVGSAAEAREGDL